MFNDQLLKHYYYHSMVCLQTHLLAVILYIFLQHCSRINRLIVYATDNYDWRFSYKRSETHLLNSALASSLLSTKYRVGCKFLPYGANRPASICSLRRIQDSSVH